MESKMMTRIEAILKKNQIAAYLITGERSETVELFFVKKVLDMRRMKDVTKYTVTVYKDFTKDEKAMRGSATTYLYSSMTDEEMEEVLLEAMTGASYINNPYYALPKGQKEEKVVVSSHLAECGLTESAKKMSEALFKADTAKDAFINSAEIFVNKRTKHIVSSEGSDVSYEKYNVEGEFITQCKGEQDVEKYNDFYYEDLCTNELEAKVKEAIEATRARAKAVSGPKAGSYKVILSGDEVRHLLGYYLEKSSLSMIYPKHSNFKVGDAVQGEKLHGDGLNITLKADVPYTEEGLAKKEHVLLENGVLKTIHGPSQFAYYMKQEPIGSYGSMKVAPGSLAFEEMKQGEYLHIVAFSDFQMDATTGFFGGEIRLAFYSDGKTVIPVTGGSLAGKLQENGESLYLSKEMQETKGYEGPMAICLDHVTIAGE